MHKVTPNLRGAGSLNEKQEIPRNLSILWLDVQPAEKPQSPTAVFLPIVRLAVF